MTFAEIITYVRDFLLEPTEGFWKDAEIFGYIKEGYGLLGASAHNDTVLTYPATGLGYIEISSDILKIHKVLVDGTVAQYVGVKGFKPDKYDEKIYYYRFENKLYIYPVQDTGVEVSLYVTSRLTLPEGTSDTPAIPEEYHTALGDYAIYKCKVKDGDNTAGDFLTQYTSKRQQLDEELSESFKDIPQAKQVIDDWGDEFNAF